MDLSDPRTMALFLEIYGTLHRAGPGSTAATLRALDLVPTRSVGTVVDLGCGPGPQTVVLGQHLQDATILALDITPSMVDEARRRIVATGLSNRVRAEVGDLLDPGLPPRSQDLIWCEGAIYNAGVAAALESWRSLLAPSGTVAFTEAVWIHPSPPEELVRWWQAQYPAITDGAGVRSAISAAGFDTVASFVLPPEAWTDEYYDPMENRITEFRAAHPDDPLAEEIAAEAVEEIEVFHANSRYYSYEFFVVQPKSRGDLPR